MVDTADQESEADRISPAAIAWIRHLQLSNLFMYTAILWLAAITLDWLSDGTITFLPLFQDPIAYYSHEPVSVPLYYLALAFGLFAVANLFVRFTKSKGAVATVNARAVILPKFRSTRGGRIITVAVVVLLILSYLLS